MEFEKTLLFCLLKRAQTILLTDSSILSPIQSPARNTSHLFHAENSPLFLEYFQCKNKQNNSFQIRMHLFIYVSMVTLVGMVINLIVCEPICGI